MAIRFLLDENLPARAYGAIVRHNAAGGDPINAVRVGQPDDLPLSADDPAILAWTERENRILVTEDKSTMPGHLKAHIEAGHHSPGVFLVRPGAKIPTLLEFLALVTHASQPAEWEDRIQYIP